MVENDLQNLRYWVTRITEEFYELVYADEWLKHVFTIDQKFITGQQIDFMVGALGGEKKYSGRSPGDAHPHIYIDEEMWERRESLVKAAMQKVGSPEEINQRWLKIDHAFKRLIILKDVSEVQKRFYSDDLIIVPNPGRRGAA
jgi:truncated hemoglobin YjbI